MTDFFPWDKLAVLYIKLKYSKFDDWNSFHRHVNSSNSKLIERIERALAKM